jgi:hypothetical protein
VCVAACKNLVGKLLREPGMKADSVILGGIVGLRASTVVFVHGQILMCGPTE